VRARYSSSGRPRRRYATPSGASAKSDTQIVCAHTYAKGIPTRKSANCERNTRAGTRTVESGREIANVMSVQVWVLSRIFQTSAARNSVSLLEGENPRRSGA
jgi:hypothetical protein